VPVATFESELLEFVARIVSLKRRARGR
jgi:hypothetical protein